jgi:hypothetical protein
VEDGDQHIVLKWRRACQHCASIGLGSPLLVSTCAVLLMSAVRVQCCW